jgi:hypothetical protein
MMGRGKRVVVQTGGVHAEGVLSARKGASIRGGERTKGRCGASVDHEPRSAVGRARACFGEMETYRGWQDSRLHGSTLACRPRGTDTDAAKVDAGGLERIAMA